MQLRYVHAQPPHTPMPKVGKYARGSNFTVMTGTRDPHFHVGGSFFLTRGEAQGNYVQFFTYLLKTIATKPHFQTTAHNECPTFILVFFGLVLHFISKL